jgi:hypothetical protein
LKTPPEKANQRNLKFGLLVELQKLEEDDSRKACPEENRRDAKHAKFGEI